jgi:hypothetical protein
MPKIRVAGTHINYKPRIAAGEARPSAEGEDSLIDDRRQT